MAGYGRQYQDTATGQKPNHEPEQQRARAAFWFLAPMLVLLVLVAAWPLARSIWFSLTDTKLDNLYGGSFVGLDNYLRWRVLESGRIRWGGTLADPAWWNAVWNTVRFALVSVTLETILGLLVALVLNAEFRGRGLGARPSSFPGPFRPSSPPKCGPGCSTTSSASSMTCCCASD
ncbi:hypothetical protein SAMN05880582_10542 [Rhizobium sp. RU20A]|nr:hypothetical protein SAMN05880582_10542 [Rhizobium sp. RU20A]